MGTLRTSSITPSRSSPLESLTAALAGEGLWAGGLGALTGRSGIAGSRLNEHRAQQVASGLFLNVQLSHCKVAEVSTLFLRPFLMVGSVLVLRTLFLSFSTFTSVVVDLRGSGGSRVRRLPACSAAAATSGAALGGRWSWAPTGRGALDWGRPSVSLQHSPPILRRWGGACGLLAPKSKRWPRCVRTEHSLVSHRGGYLFH